MKFAAVLLFLIIKGAIAQVAAQSPGSACNSELGMQSFWIQDADITASSIRDVSHDPGQARLHGNGAWMPLIQDASQFLQVDFKTEVNVSAVAIQGHPSYEYWVTRYSLLFSLDGNAWDELSEALTGNGNKHEIKSNQLSEPKRLRFLRLKPTEWYQAVALRIEIYGCEKDFSKCGDRQATYHHSRQKRIVGGRIAQPNSWPWQVEIVENGAKHACGGSIIHPQWVVTAAHCVDPFYSTTPKEIRLGEHNNMKLEGYEEVIEIDRFYVHPGFKHDRPTAVSPGDYDLALYRLKRPATFHSRVSPICLPDEDSTFPEDVGRECVVTGWGYSVEGGNFSDVLQENEVPIVSRAECNKKDSYDGHVNEHFMCAGFEAGGKDACQGDSGGPLTCQDGAGKWFLAGVVTWGIGCARPHKYGVYADVRRLLPFIESTLYGYPECGVRPVSSQISRIVGGTETRPNSWPWQVDLLFNGTGHVCGGSLIGPSLIVTSGHCFYYSDDPSLYQVRVGEHNASKYEGFEETIDIENITIHPGYKLGNATYIGDYDIAIIQLKRPAVFYKRVHSICLPDMETSFPTGKTCFATGWGRQQENGDVYSEVLREVAVNLVSKEVCNSNVSYKGMVNERYLCAGFPAGGRDSCGGDSGGPLACQNENGSFVLTGVVSWGEGCARANKYGVYLDVRSMLPFIESTLHDFSKCGDRQATYHHSRQKRIVGGRIAQPNSWPWQVEIVENGAKHACGGSIIHPQWVVTAAHCVDPFYSTTPKEIRLGEHNNMKLEGYEEVIEIDRFYVHPGFKHDRPTAVSPGDYDLALYRLKRPATFHSRVSPICLPDEDSTFPEDVGRECVVTGWGYSVEGGNFSDVLQENEVPIVSRAECNKKDSYDGHVNEHFMCAGFEAGGKDACQGDSGGPLTCQDGAGKWFLAGVVTWGIGCARPHKYGVYADVRRLLPFIESTLYGYPECGVRPVSSQISRIVGGTETRPNSWPWQVDLLFNGTGHVCGGSLIGPSLIVTSGHCFYYSDDPSLYQVRVGEHNASKYEGFEETIDIENITIHPGYKLGNATYIGDYDIAIIQLKRPAVFYKRVHSICLPDMETSFPTGKTCFATGWGRQQENGDVYSEVLREVAVNLVSKEVCNSNVSYKGMVNERYLCAGFPAGGRDSCGGDSGGPLACQNENGSFVLTGVVSWGEGCARANKYGVYLDVRSMLPFIESTLHGHPSCGKRPVSNQISRIVGGREARPNSWPWQVDLLFNGTGHVCGGSLIGPSLIVTSGHCFYYSDDPGLYQVRVGEHNASKYEGFEETIGIENITIHPGYKLGNATYIGDYDIAIIQLKRPAVFHKRVHSICLPDMETSFPTGKSCYATGWGRQQENEDVYSEVLHEVAVNLVSKEVCNSNVSYKGMVNERYLCAGFPAGGRDSCGGDSGGPLACQNENGSFVLTGVVSWGEGCARANKYGVYLDVRSMLPFIESTLHGYPKCGTRFLPASSTLVFSGREARPNSWPWQVELLFRNTHACSGALIEQDWVITSAACVNASAKSEDWEIILGEHKRAMREGYEESIKVEEIVVSSKRHIALLNLERGAILHQRVTTVCLPGEDKEFSIGSSCYVTGWGSIERPRNVSDVLNEVQVEIASLELCNVSYSGAIVEYERCVRTPRGDSEVCSVDNGAPIVCPGDDGRFVLAGVTSSEDWCSNPGKYGVFIGVKALRSYIQSTIAAKRDLINV